MKRILAWALILLLALGGIAQAEEGPWKFDDRKQELTDYTGPGGEITVPGNVGGVTVRRTASGLLIGRDDLTAVVFAEGLQVLGVSALNGLSGLTRLTLPQSLRAMEVSSLFSCPALPEVTVPYGISFVGENCFSWCGALRKITFEGECPYFLKPESNFKQIPEDAVILVPEDQLAAYQAALPLVQDRIQSSGRNAVPAPVTSEVDFTVADGVITKYRGLDQRVTVPASIGGVPVTCIGENAFLGSDAFTVVIPEGVTELRNGAFKGMSHLYHAEMPSTLRRIGEDAFHFYYGNRITLPAGLQEIGARAFWNASGIEEMTLPASLQSIGSQAFGNCRGLKKVIVQCDPGLLPADAFEGCQEVEIVREEAPAPAPTEIPAPAPMPAPVSAVSEGQGPVLEAKYLCTGADVSGNHLDASLLGGEYSVVFHADGTVTFVMVGRDFPDMTWYQDGAETVVNSYGDNKLRFVPADNGYTMDYFGSMLLTYELQP